jgi:hypothetical protein
MFGLSVIKYRVSQEERSIFFEVTVLVILTKNVYMYMCPIANGFSKIVDKEEILRTVSNTGICCSRDKVGTVYRVKYIFENSSVNINALCNYCEDMACFSSVQFTVQWNSSTSETVRNRTHARIYCFA